MNLRLLLALAPVQMGPELLGKEDVDECHSDLVAVRIGDVLSTEIVAKDLDQSLFDFEKGEKVFNFRPDRVQGKELPQVPLDHGKINLCVALDLLGRRFNALELSKDGFNFGHSLCLDLLDTIVQFLKEEKTRETLIFCN